MRLVSLHGNLPMISTPKRHAPTNSGRATTMPNRDDELRIRPGRIQHGNRGGKRPTSFVGEVMRAAKKAGHAGRDFGGPGGSKRRSTFGRGRRAALSLEQRSTS